MLAIAVVATACSSTATTPPPSDPATDATVAGFSVDAGGDVPDTLEEGESSDYAALAARIDPTGAALARAGIEAYRFVSTVEFVDRPRLGSSYVGEVTIEPPATRLEAAGDTGAFLLISSDEGTWFRFGDTWFSGAQGGFRWNPAGPIPTHAVASIIGRIALGRGTIVALGTETILGRTVQRLRRIEETLRVDVLVTADGLVLGLEMFDDLPHADRIVRWQIAEEIDSFDVDPPA